MTDTMRDILLVQLPPWGVNSPPLGLASIAAYIQKKGYSTDVYDLNVKLFSQAHDQSMWTFDRKDEWSDQTKLPDVIATLELPLQSFLEHIKKQKYRVIGLSVTQNSILFAGYLSHEIKKIDPTTYLIAGGWGCWNQHEREQLMHVSSIDAFAIGEGEELLEEVICVLEQNKRVEKVPGIILREHATTALISPRYLSKTLDEYPAPTYEGFPVLDYVSSVFSIISSRGCIGRCEFCNDRVYQGKYRVRHYSLILDEIKKHHTTYGMTTFSFNDLLINGNLQNLRALCHGITELEFSIAWIAQCMIRKDMDANDYAIMHSAGCKALQLGIESGSDHVLKKMKKFFTVSDAENALKLIHTAGIETWVNIIVGFPGETEDEFQETLDFLKHNHPYITKIGTLNTCNVVHSSLLMHEHVSHGILLPDSKDLIEVSWVGSDGNCDRIRKDRLQRVIALLSELSLPTGQDNSFIKAKEFE
ncbi:B12-binding domain-containing radical SAM protein [Candidatus Omnitrophota bacterium]